MEKTKDSYKELREEEEGWMEGESMRKVADDKNYTQFIYSRL